jgi:hypothetical protein
MTTASRGFGRLLKHRDIACFQRHDLSIAAFLESDNAQGIPKTDLARLVSGQPCSGRELLSLSIGDRRGGFSKLFQRFDLGEPRDLPRLERGPFTRGLYRSDGGRRFVWLPRAGGTVDDQ